MEGQEGVIPSLLQRVVVWQTEVPGQQFSCLCLYGTAVGQCYQKVLGFHLLVEVWLEVSHM